MPGDLELWISEISRYNRHLDLISDPPQRWPLRHILDCLSLVPHLDRLGAQSLLDIGSGAGLPGMIVAMARPELRVTLCEPAGRRATVLQTVSLLLGDRGPEVEQKPLSELAARHWHACTARAVFPAGSPMLGQAIRCCTPGGWLLLQRRGQAAARAEAEQAVQQGLAAGWELHSAPTDADEQACILILQAP